MAREKKYCINCNNPLTLKAKFCPECGTKIENVEETKIIELEEIKNELNEQPEIKPEIKIEPKETIDEETRLKKENRKLKIKKFIYPILSCFFTFALCLGAFALFYKYYLENISKVIKTFLLHILFKKIIYI